MKRIISILICLMLCLCVFAGCEKGENGDSVTATESKTAQSDKATEVINATELQTEATSKEENTDITTVQTTAEELSAKDVLKKEYEYYKSNFYELPKTDEIINTSWSSYEVLDDGREIYYSIDILEDVIKITWNDGIDSENHNFTAPWSLKTENDVCIMELDLGNLDGIRNYCILITTEKNLIYFSQDFINDDIRDYERASRVMERSFG